MTTSRLSVAICLGKVSRPNCTRGGSKSSNIASASTSSELLRTGASFSSTASSLTSEIKKRGSSRHGVPLLLPIKQTSHTSRYSSILHRQQPHLRWWEPLPVVPRSAGDERPAAKQNPRHLRSSAGRPHEQCLYIRHVMSTKLKRRRRLHHRRV